jgi:hypothetical protein
VKIKTLHGERKTHSFMVSIMDSSSKLLELLHMADPLNMVQYYQTRLIYPMGRLQTIDFKKRIFELQLPDEC